MTTEPSPSTSARLDAIEAREKAATPRPWWTSRVPAHVYSGGGSTVALAVADDLKIHDAEFVAHARQDIPDLIAFARSIAALADNWEAQAQRNCDGAEHGDGCPDCNGRWYAGQLRTALNELGES